MPGLPQRLTRWIGGLRFPVLLLVTAVVFLVNVLVPDALPFIDELLLALLTVVLSKLKRKPGADTKNAD